MSRERDRVGVVTGAGSGIGRACTNLLAECGVRVVAWDRDESSLRTFRNTALVDVAAVDVTDADSVAAAAIEAAQNGPVDFLVNCAGVFLVGALDEVNADEMRKVFEVNVIGTSLVTQALLGSLRQRGGAVVNVASAVALCATASNSHYAASKAAVVHLTRCWAVELGPAGIRVNCVAPGPVSTSIYRSAGMTDQEQSALLEARASTIPLRRVGEPDDIALWIKRFALDDAWTTGAVLAVDGGMSLV